MMRLWTWNTERMMDNLDKELNKEQTIKLESKLLEVEIERQIKLLKEQIVGINNLLGMRLSGVMSLLKTKKDLDIAIDNYISEGENDGR